MLDDNPAKTSKSFMANVESAVNIRQSLQIDLSRLPFPQDSQALDLRTKSTT